MNASPAIPIRLQFNVEDQTMSNDKQPTYLSARERQAIVGALRMLSAHAWDEKLIGQSVDHEAVDALLDHATDSYRFDMMNPDEIYALCERVEGRGS
jgi:hypothetical protein